MDVQLIQRIGVVPFLQGPRRPDAASPASLARDLGVSVETIRRRLARLRACGALQGRDIWPNLRHFGLEACSLHLEVPIHRAAPDWMKVPGVFAAYALVGDEVCVDAYYRDQGERDDLVRHLQALTGSPAAPMLDFPLPAVRRIPTNLDWRIIQALRGDADRSLPEVAQTLGVHPRTIRRRLDRLLEEGCVDLVGNFDPGAMEGQLLAYFLVHFHAGASRSDAQAVLASLSSRWVSQWSPPGGGVAHLVTVAVASSLRDVEEMRRQVESLAGVREVRSRLLQGATGSTAWIDEAIAAKVAEKAELVIAR